MKFKERLEKLEESKTVDFSTPLTINEKSNPTELARYYQDMKKLNPGVNPWILLLGMAKEAGVDPDRLLMEFPRKEKAEIMQHSATGPWAEPMSGPDIAKELGITRQAVSSFTKKGLTKSYTAIRELHPKLAPFEAFMELVKQFGMRENAMKVLRLMPKDIRSEIEKDAKKFRR